MAARNGIENYLDTLLNADGLEDYGPNGWRVEAVRSCVASSRG